MDTNQIFPIICGGWILFMLGFLAAGLLTAASKKSKPAGVEIEIAKQSFKEYMEAKELKPSPFMVCLMREYFSYLDQDRD